MPILIKNCKTLEHKDNVDLLIESDEIANVGEKIVEKAEEEINAEGNLVLPSFVEPHIHLDKAFLSERLPEAKSMAEARRLVREAKSSFSKEDVAERAERCIKMAIINGVTFMRTHVDIDSIVGLRSFEALTELKNKYKRYLTLQIVAFPQEGIFRDASAYETIQTALDRGADAVGGLPEAEVDKEKGVKHVQKLVALASQRKVQCDMHLDVQPYTNYVEHFIAEVSKCKLNNKATADHLIALSYYDDAYAKKIIAMLKKEGINVVSNPCTMMVGGRDATPTGRGVTRIKELLASGVNIAFGLDNVVDPYNPFGDFNPLKNAWLFAYEGQLNSESEMTKLLEMPTYSSSKILGLSRYGLQKGCRADLNILQTSSIREALRTASKPAFVIRSGKIIVRRKEVVSALIDN